MSSVQYLAADTGQACIWYAQTLTANFGIYGGNPWAAARPAYPQA